MLYAKVVEEKKDITMKLTVFFSEVITKCLPLFGTYSLVKPSMAPYDVCISFQLLHNKYTN